MLGVRGRIKYHNIFHQIPQVGVSQYTDNDYNPDMKLNMFGIMMTLFDNVNLSSCNN